MAVLRAPSIVRPLGRPLCGSFAPLPPSSHPQDWFSGLSPTDEEEHFFKARCLSEKQVPRPHHEPFAGLQHFFSVLGPISALVRFFQQDALD